MKVAGLTIHKINLEHDAGLITMYPRIMNKVIRRMFSCFKMNGKLWECFIL